MKFEYDVVEDSGECVAYIDKYGHLVIKDTCGSPRDCFAMSPNLGAQMNAWNGFDECDSVKKFYRGDKITITF